MFFELTETFTGFPHPSLSEPDGLLAIGGDLSSERLRLAYAFGIFPWYSEEEPILWYAPHQRCVLFPDEVYVSHSMRSLFRSNRFSITSNKAFNQVIKQCASQARPGQLGTWISAEMIAAYQQLHQLGVAHSVEVWQHQNLVGGLYGVINNKIFCGESMFSLMANASKSALIWLCRTGKFNLIDCQLPNDHLLRMGARMISSEDYLQYLRSSSLRSED